ncbi:MAG: hypothetical protein ISP41_03700 [Alphaproteobacteria bacterium]|nr:hypothetical protein [Alphaproteobacteria bacterium]
MAPLSVAEDAAVLGLGATAGADAREAVRTGFGAAGAGGVETMLGAFGGALALGVTGTETLVGAGCGFRAGATIFGGFGVGVGARVARMGLAGRVAVFVTGVAGATMDGVLMVGAAIRGRVGLAIGRGAGWANPMPRVPTRGRSPLNGSRPLWARA